MADFRSATDNDTHPSYPGTTEDPSFVLVALNLTLNSTSHKPSRHLSYLDTFPKTFFGEKVVQFFSIFLPLLLIAGTFILIFSKVLNVLEVILILEIHFPKWQFKNLFLFRKVQLWADVSHWILLPKENYPILYWGIRPPSVAEMKKRGTPTRW